MLVKRLGDPSFDKSHPDKLWSPPGSRPTGTSKLLTTGEAVAAVDDSKGHTIFEEQGRFPLLKYMVDMDCAKAPGDGVRDSHKIDTILALVGF